MAAALYAAGYVGYDQADRRVKSGVGRAALDGIGFITGYENIQQDWGIITNSCMDIQCKLLAVGDLALNATYGVSMFSGLGQSWKSIRAARAMRKMSEQGRLEYIRNIAKASGVEKVKEGKNFFRPPGRHEIKVPRDALGNPGRLAGGFFHELTHHGQEFGTNKYVSWLPKGAQRLSAAISGRNPGAKRGIATLLNPLYTSNPVEVQAAARGIAHYSENGALLALGRGEAWVITQSINMGCKE